MAEPANSGPFGSSQEISPNVGLRGGGCSLLRTCLSLQFGEMQGDFDEMQGRAKPSLAKNHQISRVWMGSPYSRSREAIIAWQGRESRIANHG
jgi:hypothetical protein